MNGENQTENWVTALIPGRETRSNFMWTVVTLRVFVGRTLQAVNVVLSDGNNELCDALDYAIMNGIFNTKTLRLLCFFHTIILHMKNNIGWVDQDIRQVTVIYFDQFLFQTNFLLHRYSPNGLAALHDSVIPLSVPKSNGRNSFNGSRIRKS